MTPAKMQGYTPIGRRWICIEAPDCRLPVKKLNELDDMVEIEPVTGAAKSYMRQSILTVIPNPDGDQAIVQVEVRL